MPDLALGDQVLHCPGDVFDRHVRVHAVLIEEIDDVRPETLQRRLGDLLDVRRPAAEAALLAVIRVDVEAELGGDHHAVAHRGQGLTHKLLVGEGAIDLGGVEEGDAALDGRADQGDGGTPVHGRPVAEVQPHAAKADGRDLEAAVSEQSLLHCLLLLS